MSNQTFAKMRGEVEGSTSLFSKPEADLTKRTWEEVKRNGDGE
jgi:hypothetical protein